MLDTEFAHTFNFELVNLVRDKKLVNKELDGLSMYLDYFLYSKDDRLILSVTHIASTVGEALADVIDLIDLEAPNVHIGNMRVVESYTKSERL